MQTLEMLEEPLQLPHGERRSPAFSADGRQNQTQLKVTSNPWASVLQLRRSCSVTSWPLEDFLQFKPRKTGSGRLCPGGIRSPSLHPILSSRARGCFMDYKASDGTHDRQPQCRLAKGFPSSPRQL